MAKGTLKISGADSLLASDLAPNSVDTSELVAGAVTGAKIAYLGDGAGNLTGTISSQQLHLADTFTLTGDLTVNDDLILGKARDDGTGQTLTHTASTARILSGTGTLTMGSYVEGGEKDRATIAENITDGSVTSSKLDTNITIAGDFIPSTPLSHRNMIINGAMQVDQRGTATGVGSLYAGPDRFSSFISAAGTWEQSQHAMTSAELNTTGFSSAYKMKCTVANASIGAAGYVSLGQKLEAQNLQHLKWGSASAKNMTLSFWVKSAKAGTHVVQLFHDESTGYNSIAYTINVVNTWEYKTMTFSGHPSIAIDNNSDSGFRVYFWLDAGSNLTSGTLTNNTWHTTVANRAAGQVTLADAVDNEFYLTGVQLELGSNATPFEHRSYGDELQRCQRYFQRLGVGTTSTALGMGVTSTASTVQVAVPLATVMRASPTVTVSNMAVTDWQNYTTALSNPANTYATASHVSLNFNGSGWTAFRPCLFVVVGSGSGYTDFTAEL